MAIQTLPVFGKDKRHEGLLRASIVCDLGQEKILNESLMIPMLKYGRDGAERA